MKLFKVDISNEHFSTVFIIGAEDNKQAEMEAYEMFGSKKISVLANEIDVVSINGKGLYEVALNKLKE